MSNPVSRRKFMGDFAEYLIGLAGGVLALENLSCNREGPTAAYQDILEGKYVNFASSIDKRLHDGAIKDITRGTNHIHIMLPKDHLARYPGRNMEDMLRDSGIVYFYHDHEGIDKGFRRKVDSIEYESIMIVKFRADAHGRHFVDVPKGSGINEKTRIGFYPVYP